MQWVLVLTFLPSSQALNNCPQQRCSILDTLLLVERAIGRMKNFSILKSNLPLTMARLANQIVCFCAWLTVFQPSLVPLPQSDDADSDTEVDNYFDTIYDSDYDADDSEEKFRVILTLHVINWLMSLHIIEGLRSKTAIKHFSGEIDVFALTYPRLIKEHAAAVLTYQRSYFRIYRWYY